MCWGGNAVAGKLASADWPPYTITATRWLLAALLLLPFAWQHLKNDKEKLKSHWHILLALGAFGMALFNLFMYQALNYTTAINVSIEQAAMPAMILLANFFLFSQRTTVLQVLGLICSIIGVLVTTTSGRPWIFFTEGLNFGDAIMLVACAFYAGYTIGLRWRPKIHWLSFMQLLSVGAFMMALPFAWWEWQQQDITFPAIKSWAVMVYIVLFPTLLAQTLYARAVELIGGNRAGQFINLVPIFGSLFAILILNERFHWFHAVGLVMVVGGIWLAERFAVAEAPN